MPELTLFAAVLLAGAAVTSGPRPIHPPRRVVARGRPGTLSLLLFDTTR